MTTLEITLQVTRHSLNCMIHKNKMILDEKYIQRALVLPVGTLMVFNVSRKNCLNTL